MLKQRWPQWLRRGWRALAGGTGRQSGGPRRVWTFLRVRELEPRIVPATPPDVLSIARTLPLGPITSASSVSYTLTFDQPVTGVAPADFRLTETGSVLATTPVVVTPATVPVPGQPVYTVTVNGIHGSGTLRLDLIDDDTITAGSSLPLGGSGPDNGSFQGQTYTILQTYPSVLSINRTNPTSLVTGLGSVTFTVTFSKPVTGVDPTDFTLALTGSVTASTPLAVAGSGSVYTVTVSGITGNGTLGLNLVDNGTIRDLDGNPLVQPNAPAAFQNQATFATGIQPASVAVADLRGDGKSDLVVANVGSNSVSVLLGNGNGTFQPQQTYATGFHPTSVAVADVNGDGKPDLVVANANGNSVSVLLGNGDGTFQSQQTYATGFHPTSVAVADVNGDGKPDLVVANYAGGAVSVLLGNGDGTFMPQQTYATGIEPVSVAVADLRGDGKLDLVVANVLSNSVSVLLGNGNGTFQTQQTYATGIEPFSVAVADVNGDDKPDLVVANTGSSVLPGKTVSVLLGNGDGTFMPQQTFVTGSEPRSVAVADVNGDGEPDLLVANEKSNSVSVLLGNGTFQPQQTFSTGSVPVPVAVADVNGDGKPDLVVANYASNSVSVLLGNGNGNFTGQTYIIVQTSPSVLSIDRSNPTSLATGLSSVTFTVTFNEPVTGVDPTDFKLALTGTVAATLTQVTPVSGSVYTVTVSGITGSGTLGLNLSAVNHIFDLASNPLTAGFTGQVYTIGIPTVSVGGEAFVAEGTSLARSGSFTDPGGSSWTATVDYGDGAGAQPLALNADKTFVLNHVYTEGHFTVTVVITNNLGGIGTGTFEVQVLPASFQSVSFATVQPGQTATISAISPTSSITFTLVRSAADVHAAEFLVGTLLNVPLPALPAGTVILGEYEARVIGAESLDEGFVTFRYPADAFLTGTPVLQFLDGNTLLPVISSRQVGSVVFDRASHTISVVYDITSLPTLMGLGNTVFTVSVNAVTSQIPVNIQPAVALNATAAAGLTGATAFQSTSQLTFTLAPSQASQVSASQSVLSGVTGGGNPVSNPVAAAAQAAWIQFLVEAMRDDPEQLWFYGGEDALFLWLQQGNPNAPAKPASPKDKTPGPADPATNPEQGAPDGADPEDEEDPGDEETLEQAFPLLFQDSLPAAPWRA